MKDKKVKFVKITTILTIIVMFISIIILTCQFIQISSYKKEVSSLEAEKQSLIQEIYNFNTANSYYDNNRSEFLEEYAREHLTWGSANEVWYTQN